MTADHSFRLVQSDAAWRDAATALRGARRLAVDVEADGFHRYPERVSLVQIRVDGGSTWLIDPLAVSGLHELGTVLAAPDVAVVMHASSYDVRSLDRDYSFAVRGLFDTAIAAQLAGARQTGLANVLLSCLGLELAKPKRLQRTDWSRRPLEPEELDYAAADVAHLLPLADALRDRLQALGRTDWVTEECGRQERERYRRPDPPEEAFLSVRGARDLDDRGRAVLRELCVLRECEARGLGRPPYRVMSESALVDLAGRPTTSRPMPAGVDPRLWRSPGRRRLQEAIARGLEAEPVAWPKRTRSVWSRQAQLRLRALKEWRHEEAARLDLDAGVVWPADHLKQLALHPDRPTADLDPECDPPCVRQWQWRELGPSLEAFRRESLGDRV